MNTVFGVLFHVPVEAIDVSQHFHNSWKHAHISIQKYRPFKVHNWRKKLIRKKTYVSEPTISKIFHISNRLVELLRVKMGQISSRRGLQCNGQIVRQSVTVKALH